MNRLKRLWLSVLVLVVLVGGLPALAAAAPGPTPPPPGADKTPLPVPAPNGGPAALPDTPAPAPNPDLSATEGWTARSHWWRNPDGSRTLELYSEPAFRDTGRGWVPIDPTVRPTGDAAVPFAAEGGVRPIRFGRQPSRVAEVALAAGTVTLSAPELAVGAPRAEGNDVRYPDVAPDTDLRYAVSGHGLKEELVLRSATAPREFRFHLSDPARALGSPHVQADGSVVFDRGADGLAVVLPAPVAYPENVPDGGVRPRGEAGSAHLRVVPAGDGFDLTVSLDAAWAKDKQFPLILDPTIVLQPDPATAKEGYIAVDPTGQYASGLAPAGDSLLVGTDATQVLRSAVRFDTSSIPANSKVTSASLGLYWDGWCIAGTSGTLCYGASYGQSYTIEAHRITAGGWLDKVAPGSPYIAYDVPYDPAVAASTVARATSGTIVNHNEGWDAWNLASLTQSWINGQADNHGMLLKLANEALDQSGPAYESSAVAFTNSPANRPKLTVTYTPPGPTNPAPPDQLAPATATRFTTAPTLSARYSDPGGVAGQVYFEVRDAVGAVVASSWSAQVASGATAAWKPTLGDGAYSWRAQAYNGSGYSPWSAVNAFSLAKAPAAGAGTGDLHHYRFESVPLTDRLGMGANVANGNAVVRQADLRIPGTGLDLAVDRYYNSQSGANYGNGVGWVLGTGRDVGLALAPDGSQVFEGPSGFRATFTKNPDGSYTTPTGLDATLVRNADATFTLRFHASDEKLNFTSGGYLASDVDRNGNGITFAYTPAARLASITDTQGRVTTPAYNASGLLASVTDPAGRVARYGYDDAARLIKYTDAANGVTNFAYDGAHRLTSIFDPLSQQTQLAYDGTGRLARVTRAGQVQAAATYTYTAGSTTSTNANGHPTTYTYDSVGRVTRGSTPWATPPPPPTRRTPTWPPTPTPSAR